MLTLRLDGKLRFIIPRLHAIAARLETVGLDHEARELRQHADELDGERRRQRPTSLVPRIDDDEDTKPVTPWPAQKRSSSDS